MDFEVIFKDTFLEDLERIVAYIAAENPGAARKFGELVIRMRESSAFFPSEIRRFANALESGDSS